MKFFAAINPTGYLGNDLVKPETYRGKALDCSAKQLLFVGTWSPPPIEKLIPPLVAELCPHATVMSVLWQCGGYGFIVDEEIQAQFDALAPGFFNWGNIVFKFCKLRPRGALVAKILARNYSWPIPKQKIP
jgi:hypothetical protein